MDWNYLRTSHAGRINHAGLRTGLLALLAGNMLELQIEGANQLGQEPLA